MFGTYRTLTRYLLYLIRIIRISAKSCARTYLVLGNALRPYKFMRLCEGNLAIFEVRNRCQGFHSVALFFKLLFAALEILAYYDTHSCDLCSRLFNYLAEGKGCLAMGQEVIDDKHILSCFEVLL